MRTNGAAGPQDALITVKYDSDGKELWRRTYLPMRRDYFQLAGSAADAAGDLILAGTANLGLGMFEFLVIKVDRNGELLWTAQDDAEPGENFATAFALDADGAVCLTGGGGSGFRTVKFSSDGERLWVAMRPGRYSTSAVGQHVGVDPQHNVVVCGYERRRINEDDDQLDCVAVKYDQAGAELWSARSAFLGRTPAAMALDRDGNIYVAGPENSLLIAQMFLLQYDPAGHELWEQSIRNSRTGAIVLDSAGHVYLTSAVYASPEDTIQLRKFTRNDVPGQPVATITPKAADVVAGGNFTFAASTTGLGTLKYQWHHDGLKISGATNAILSLTDVQPQSVGNYTVRVQNKARLEHQSREPSDGAEGRRAGFRAPACKPSATRQSPFNGIGMADP